MGQIEERLGEIAKLIQSDQDANALRSHLRQLLDSPSFLASRRSGQFLQYVVENALHQQTDALKERTIGVEVFHRAPDYDTGEDAIVRVTASDVRRRLAQYYSKEGRGSEFRISLPPGGYAPEVYRDLSLPTALVPQLPRFEPDPPALSGDSAKPGPPAKQTAMRRWGFRNQLLGSFTVGVLLLSGFLLFGRRHFTETQAPSPWSLLFVPGKPLLVVLADPDLNEIQLLTHKYVSLSDYAAGKLGCDGLQPDLQAVCRGALRGDKVATVDANAIAKIASLSALFHSSVEPHAAREIRLPDLQTDRNLVLLGSRTANPWTDLFRDRLDFYVSHDDATGLQVVHNTHRRPGEDETYMPTAGPYGAGDNYTLISFLHNLSGTGYAMLLTGGTHEGMDAAMEVVLDQEHLGNILKGCGVPLGAPFQILLKLKMIAGAPLSVKTVVCHGLTERS